MHKSQVALQSTISILAVYYSKYCIFKKSTTVSWIRYDSLPPSLNISNYFYNLYGVQCTLFNVKQNLFFSNYVELFIIYLT